MTSIRQLPVNILTKIGVAASQNAGIRHWFLEQVKHRIYKDLILANPDNRLAKVQEDKYIMGTALLNSINKAFSKGHISKKAAQGLLSVFLGNVFFGGFYKRRDFMERHGFRPPMFITISPTGACNLKCIGCYAASNENLGKLPFSTLDKIIEDAKNLWTANFFVLSGGEPLIYKSEGKTIIDLAAKHPDCFFLMYTNGTLIDPSMAQKLAEIGNITPAISVEGMKKETDERRGSGVFKKIEKAMANLRNVGVPFGMSITVTRHNADIITSPEFLNYYFEKQGAIYAWVFHYMPIGREFTLDLLPTVEQRVDLLFKEWDLVRKKQIFLADFWNSGTSSDGCISGARSGGYFYINWNGDVMPCVFMPYSLHNILDVYKNGGNLDTVIQSNLFKAIRKWQAEYGYEQPPDKVRNLLRQCPIRDHYGDLYKILKATHARPIDKDAELALEDAEYRKGLIEYGKRIEELTKEYWEKKYLNRENSKQQNAKTSS